MRVHYSWIILFTSFFVVAGSLGIGRFSYGMLLPSLQEGIGLTHSQTGFIASANMIGYSLAAAAVGILVSRYGSRWIISFSLVGVALSMMAIGLVNAFFLVLFLRFVTGFCSAGANISVMGLSSRWVARNVRGTANGFLVGGSGVAILLTGRVVPFIMDISPEQGWRYNWLILGGAVLLISLLTWRFLRNQRGKGLNALGARAGSLADGKDGVRDYCISEVMHFSVVRFMAFTYFCYGISYIVYTTFIVNYLIGEKGLSQAAAGDIWSLVGFLSIGSAVIWGGISDKTGRPAALAMVFFLQGASYIISASAAGETFMWVSAVIFGLTAWSIPGIMASFCGDILGPKNATTILGLVTLFFSLGSIMGPASGGYIKEVSNSFAGALYLAAAFALAGALLSFAMWKKNVHLVTGGKGF